MSQKSPNRLADFASLVRALATAKTPWAVVAIIGLALILASCTVDRERLVKTREDLELLCQGALTLPLKAACARAGISTAGSTVVE